jgi:hypothetical protein
MLFCAPGSSIAEPAGDIARKNPDASFSEFRSEWENSPDRVWAGAEYWTNPLQDWRVAAGRLECVKAAPARTIHLLTRELTEGRGAFALRVRLGRIAGGALSDGCGAAGFAIGVRGSLRDHRNNLFHGAGLHAGLRPSGELFIGNGETRQRAVVSWSGRDVIELRLRADPEGDFHRLTLTAHEPGTEREIGRVVRDAVPANQLSGNLALIANPDTAAPDDCDRWWFSDWRVGGEKIAAHPARAFGPLWFNQYTLHRGTMKMTAQLPPLGVQDERAVRLETRAPDGAWQTRATATLHPLARTATFRCEGWDDRVDTPYRLAYALRTKDGRATEHYLDGVVRRDPVEKDELTVADISCNAHHAFPNSTAAASFATLDPDLVAFTGDQYYESSGGYRIDTSGVENSVLDVLRKWTMHGWTWRELTRDRPSISLPDDHDVYHGNLWGENGAAAPGLDGKAESLGGYKMPPDFVNAVHAMQTAHHPDSPAQSGKQGITGYYGPLTYGRVSFALLADRQYKSAPDGKVPPTTSGRADHVLDPNFDPQSADLPGLDLLGDEQMKFLRAWTEDWRGADMKAAISQTIFTAMATHHGPHEQHLVADYDTNAWPQTPRNDAVRELRRVFAFHIAGDQHLPALVHYGVDAHRDGGVAFASPAINNLYPRRFMPEGRAEANPLGDFRDSFGHPLTVLACANPQRKFRSGVGVLEAETDKVAGLGLVRFNKRTRAITIDCWPLLADVTRPGTQFPGWPVTVAEADNYARPIVAHLPMLDCTEKFVVTVIAEATGEVLYRMRAPEVRWRPPVFAEGLYMVRVSEPESGRSVEFTAQRATSDNRETLSVKL